MDPIERAGFRVEEELDESDFTFTTIVGGDMKQIVEKLQMVESKMAAMERDKAATTQMAADPNGALPLFQIGLQFGEIKREIAELKAENGKSKKENEKLKEEIIGVKGQMGKLEEENSALKGRIEELGKELAKLRQTEQGTNFNMGLMEITNSSMLVERATVAGMERENGEESILEESADDLEPIELIGQNALENGTIFGNGRGNEGTVTLDSTAIEQEGIKEEAEDSEEEEEEGSIENEEDGHEQMEMDEEESADEDIDTPVADNGQGNVRNNNGRQRGQIRQKHPLIVAYPKEPLEIGAHFMDRFGKLWYFHSNLGKDASTKLIRNKFGLSCNQNTRTRFNLLCPKYGPAPNGKCPYVGIYLKANGCLYTRKQHEHCSRMIKTPNVGDDFVDHLKQTWKFVANVGQNADRVIFGSAQFGFKQIREQGTRFNLYCRKNVVGGLNGGKCPFAGIYLKANGCLYTRGRHEHGDRGEQQKNA